MHAVLVEVFCLVYTALVTPYEIAFIPDRDSILLAAWIQFFGTMLFTRSVDLPHCQAKFTELGALHSCSVC